VPGTPSTTLRCMAALAFENKFKKKFKFFFAPNTALTTLGCMVPLVFQNKTLKTKMHLVQRRPRSDAWRHWRLRSRPRSQKRNSTGARVRDSLGVAASPLLRVPVYAVKSVPSVTYFVVTKYVVTYVVTKYCCNKVCSNAVDLPAYTVKNVVKYIVTQSFDCEVLWRRRIAEDVGQL
jgi:hypothetical protein